MTLGPTVEIASKTLSCLVPGIVKTLPYEMKNLRNTFGNEEGMAGMDEIVDTVHSGKDDKDRRDDIDGDVPEMKKSNNISEGEDHNEDDKDADLEVTVKKDSNKEYTDHSQSHISPKLIIDYFICIPSSIDFTLTKFVWRVCRMNHFCHRRSGSKVRFRPLKDKIRNRNF